LFEVKKGVAYITMNRVAANNALNDSLSAGLFDAVHECRGRTDIRVVVLKANGKMFCAGGDPKSFQDAAAMSDADNKRGALEFAGFLYTFQTLPQFTVCLAQGSAMGGGVGLVSICDMCIAVKAAHFTLSEVKLGVIPATISPYVVGKIGVSNAKRLFCTAENCNADLAKSMGLVTDVVDSADAFPAKVKEICDKITMCAPAAVASAKKLVMNVANQPVSQELINYTSDELSRVKKTEEAKDGMKAVQNRTKPAWATAAIEPSL
jgi:methylglutaconyl-CoA hydratase